MVSTLPARLSTSDIPASSLRSPAVLAHAATDLAPAWLLVSALVVGTTLTWLWLRTAWPAPRLGGEGRTLPTWTATAARIAAVIAGAVGLAVWALTLTAGLFAGDEDAAQNLAPFVVNIQLLAAGMMLAAVAGDWWQAASPFTTLARVLPDRSGAKDAPAWTAPALLASFVWVVVCYHDNDEPRALGLWLAAYTVAVLGGAALWGRWWTATGEGFAVLFAAMARMAPLARDPATGRIVLRAPLAGLGGGPLPAGAEPTVLLAACGAVFASVQRTDWWQLDIMGARTGWDRTLVDTVGLAFVVGVAALVLLAATRARGAVGPAIVSLALGVTVAFLLTEVAFRVVDAVALLSDPYGRRWDLLGTADWHPDPRWLFSTRLAWAEVAALAAGAMLSVVVAHDGTLRREKGRASAERALLPQLGAGTLLGAVALLILLA